MPDNTHEQVAWNLSEILIRQIGSLLNSASKEFIEGKISSAFTSMQTIKLLIYHDLVKDEIDSMEIIEEKAHEVFNVNHIHQGFTVNQDKKRKYFEGRQRYIAYNNLIMKALKRHGYSIPPKPDTARII